MAPTIFQTFLLTVLLIVPEFSNANQSPFQFLEDLKGYHKGDKVEGIHELKQYLNQFGYLNYNHDHSKVQNVQTNSDEKDDHFDDILESAIKTYQLNYHLKPTGVLDPKTISTMMLPRCGVSDIMINGATRMRAEIQDNSSTSSNVTADIRIGFYSRDHGDGYPFDGPYGVLAHASAPTSGSFHLDADEPWSIGPVPDHIDLETVALHEIGHLLGLQHSSVTDAIMYPSVSDGMAKELHGDDVQGIKDLYSKV
ncbi:Metalloendoproteinase 1 [Heracleum sosnowskyi]|uniref:Metalloendoproteinase 1 n=1 Tax=Heracleum sosnowskyi TaxID=360622 RepID=A0AAD8HXR5_9APIA|nr:Metalloendoproteinase 1 [Heracleum sosnowskyi]